MPQNVSKTQKQKTVVRNETEKFKQSHMYVVNDTVRIYYKMIIREIPRLALDSVHEKHEIKILKETITH